MAPRVLLIEDNEQNRYMATFLLEKSGFEVLHAWEGLTGIELALREQVDLVLLDIQLPGMDGYAVARELRRHRGLEGIPIIAVTSYAMVGDREKSLEAGCDGYLEKPINPHTFVADISRFLSTSGRGEES